MKEQTINIICKSLIVIGLGSMSIAVLMVFPGSLIWWTKYTEIVFNVLTIIFLITGFCYIIFIYTVGYLVEHEKIKIIEIKVKAERYPLRQKTYEELFNELKDQLVEREYVSHETILLAEEGSINIFTRKTKSYGMSAYTILRVSNLTEKILEEADEKIDGFLEQYYGKKRITDRIEMTLIPCVDRVGSSFYHLVDVNLEQEIKKTRLIVGVSFGGKKIYIATQKDGMSLSRYKRMKKEFIELMNIEMKEK